MYTTSYNEYIKRIQQGTGLPSDDILRSKKELQLKGLVNENHTLTAYGRILSRHCSSHEKMNYISSFIETFEGHHGFSVRENKNEIFIKNVVEVISGTYDRKNGLRFKYYLEHMIKNKKDFKDCGYLLDNHEKIRPFIIDDYEQITEETPRPEETCIPFDFCSFEAVNPEGILSTALSDGYVVLFDCAFAYEKPDGKTEVLYVGHAAIDNNIEIFALKEEHVYWEFQHNLSILMNRKTHSIGRMKKNTIIKNRKEKTKAKIKDIVVIGKKGNKSISLGGIRAEYSHRFEVMGHWRNIKGIGKNRQGEYCISGRTWVKDFVKGNQESPLVVKKRIGNLSREA